MTSFQCLNVTENCRVPGFYVKELCHWGKSGAMDEVCIVLGLIQKSILYEYFEDLLLSR